MERFTNAQPRKTVVTDTLHIPNNYNPVALSNQKPHSFLAIPLATFYLA